VELPDFDDVGDWMLQLGAELSPAELHGLLCGQVAGGLAPGPAQWLGVAGEVLEVPVYPGTAVAEGLECLRAATLAQYADADFSLQLLLAPEEATLAEKLESLACWCHGFLAGFALAGNTEAQLRQLAPECSEILADLVEISRIDEAADEGEAAEQELMEVCEYVRAGAMQIFLELNPPAAGARPDVLH